MLGKHIHLGPRYNACSFGHVDVVGALLGAGAAPAARDNWGYTPLHEAAAKGKVDVRKESSFM